MDDDDSTERMVPSATATSRSPATRAGEAARALRVPEITIWFWIIKALSTALGESTSDYLVHAIDPVVAVGIGFVGFVAALALQLSRRRYIAWAYWLAVVMVGIFGTMAADVLHVGFHVPYVASALLYAVVLAAVFVTWQRTEGTLSVHTIDTTRRPAEIDAQLQGVKRVWVLGYGANDWPIVPEPAAAVRAEHVGKDWVQVDQRRYGNFRVTLYEVRPS